ncbi:MAG: DUF4268 domain-containing protein [Pelomonas sp.]|nr:DUF4268 domain-containing protein [Roseateles sp.]
MFRINHESNRIIKVQPVSFSELGFTERNHLQEWLANQPDALGEDLLIIQKEFDGFDDTRERLDLLAIDKQGKLVIIENKLDDSGRDVVWQALKYASYCWTLSTAQVADVFQKYLDRSAPGQNAQALICEFLGKAEFGDVVLNSGDDQRLILVAAQFRKEVTSTVLWLLKHQVDVKCFKATPYRDAGDLFLTVEQVIPLPEAEALMIGISTKEAEEHATERGLATRHQLRLEFWNTTLQALQAARITRYANVGPSKDHWLDAGSGMSGVYYSMVLNRDEARVDFALDTGSKEANKFLFDHLFSRRAQLDAEFGEPLQWRRMEDRKVSLIECAAPFDGHNRAAWPAIVEWLVSRVRQMEAVFDKEIAGLRQAARAFATKDAAG